MMRVQTHICLSFQSLRKLCPISSIQKWAEILLSPKNYPKLIMQWYRVNQILNITINFGAKQEANYSLKVDPRHIDDDYVILHEMIHMHEFVLEIYPTYYHDAILYSLYHDLRSKIEDLDRRMERQGHIVMQEELAQFGGVHDLLFLLKSFDLDLRMNYPLGTVFGYGMAD